jgi:hypothetical protein
MDQVDFLDNLLQKVEDEIDRRHERSDDDKDERRWSGINLRRR